MEERITKEELLERLFHDDYENLKGSSLRLPRVRVPGKDFSFAHVFTPNDRSIYENLALHIGVHEGEDHRGDAIGHGPCHTLGGNRGCGRCWERRQLMLEVGFMDRFCGTLILTGGFTEVMTAVEEVMIFP